MDIIIINKDALQNTPPFLNSVLSLYDLGFKITVICVDINDYWRKELEKRNIKYCIIPDKTRRNTFNKIIEYLNFRKRTLNYLKQIGIGRKNSLLWIIGGNTVLCLGKVIKRYRYLLHILELHENDSRIKRVLQMTLPDAQKVFVCEFNRAVMFQCWYKLKKRPTVLPNKPYFISTDTQFDLSTYVDSAILERIKTSRVLLFQGQIVSYRDLSPYIKAAKEIGGYQVVLLGNEYGMVAKYKQIDNSIIYIKHLPVPHYLGITTLAHICLITYTPDSLNNAYCAPNKYFEYGAFGKPMLGNDIPGLKVIEDYHAGILVDEDNLDSIKTAFLKIEDNYQSFSEGAKRLFDSVNNKETIANSLKSIL